MLSSFSQIVSTHPSLFFFPNLFLMSQDVMEENEVYKSLEAKIKRLEDEVSLSNHKHDESMVHVLSTTSFPSLLLYHLSHASPFITLTETYEQRGCWYMIDRGWSQWLKHANKHSRWGQWPMQAAAELLKWYGRYDPIPPTPLLSLTLPTALTLLTLPTSPTLSIQPHTTVNMNF